MTLPILTKLRLLSGAICPAEGKAAGIVMPGCNSEAMSMHLEEIACHVAPARMRSFCSIRPDDTERPNWSRLPTSR